MKIDGYSPLPESSLPKRGGKLDQSSAKNQAEGASGIQDEARLSVDREKTSRLESVVAGLPEVRQDRVEQLRGAMQEGRYQISDEQLADAMISDLLK